MKIEITEKDVKRILKEWEKIPQKYDSFKNMRHGGTDNFKCKYPVLRNLIKKLEVMV